MSSFQIIYYLLIFSGILCAIIFVFHKGFFVLKADGKKYETKITTIENKIGGYLINLDKDKDRLNKVLPTIQNLKIDIDRISGVEGNALTDKQIEDLCHTEEYYKLNGRYPKKGTIGCYMSHVKTWQEFIQSDNDYAIIFEDDISFDPKILKLHLSELLKNNKLWDLCLFEISHRGTPLTIKKLSDKYKLSIYLTNISHAGAYIINRESAIKLLTHSMPIIMPLDHFFLRSWELKTKATGIEPRIVFQTFGTSEIDATKPHIINKGNSKYLFNKAVYKTKTELAKFFYNLYLYVKLN